MLEVVLRRDVCLVHHGADLATIRRIYLDPRIAASLTRPRPQQDSPVSAVAYLRTSRDDGRVCGIDSLLCLNIRNIGRERRVELPTRTQGCQKYCIAHKINTMYCGAIQYNTPILPILMQYIKLYTAIFKLASFHCTARTSYSPRTSREGANPYPRSTTFVADASTLVYLILDFIR